MSLDLYASLFTNHLEAVADRVDSGLAELEWHESGTNGAEHGYVQAVV